MIRILQIATVHHSLKADFSGEAALPVLLWALVEEDGTTAVVGMVMDPETNQLVCADQREGFRGYTP